MESLSDIKTKAIAGNIRKIREFRNYTQDYLAAKLEISQNAYSKIELGYSNITLRRLINIAEILEIDLGVLINHKKEEIIQLKTIQELNVRELIEINGGAIFGTDNSSSENGFGSLKIADLLSFSNETRDGDEHTSTSGSIGNGINVDLGGMFKNMTS